MKKLIILFAFLISFLILKTQSTYFIIHNVYWATYYQNMWGPEGSPYSIDFHYELFNINYSDQFSFGYIVDLGLFGEWGAMFNFNLWLLLGSDFDMYGWTTGWVDVEYPVKLIYEIPNDYTFNPGEIVTIKTSYEVLPGWNLNSQFPQAGVISLDLDYGFGIDISAQICVYSCSNIQLINLQVPPDSFYIFYLNGQTGEVSYPCYDPSSFPPFTICHDDILPIYFNNLFGIGLSGWITLPYIPTTDWLDTSDPCHAILGANGDSTYAQITLDIIQFLGFIAGFLPPPYGPLLQQFLSMLSGSISFSIITIQWNLLSAYLQMTNTLQQDLTFTPTIYSNFKFPLPVEYWIHNPHNGNQLVDHGISDSISVVTCMNLSYKYPCYGWPEMPIGLSAHLDNEFNNHVWDSIAFDFIVQALQFTLIIDLPFKNAVVIPEFCLPITDSIGNMKEICLPPILDKDFEQIKQALDSITVNKQISPQISIKDTLITKQLHDNTINEGQNDNNEPPLQILDWSITIGPLIDLSIPLGYFPFTWFNETWELAGFHDTIFPPFTMIPNPEFQVISVSHTNNVCAGDSIGTITITVENGTPPYTYILSNGDSATVSNTTYTFVGLISGTYSVTISDANNCSHTINDITIIETNPPIYITLLPVNVKCHGDSTGIIYSQVVGGTPPYTYTWIPMGGNQETATGLPAGEYTLSVVDAVGCPQTATTTITQPETAVFSTIDSVIHIKCYGESTGAIYISVSGGTPPYTYLWSNGYTQEDLINAPAYTYTVTVSDSYNCTKTLVETINQPPLLAGLIFPTHVTCYGFSNGSANLVVAGGTPPYSYIWNTGETTEDINNLTAGTYTVTITDANNCTATSSITINQPLEPLAITYNITHVLCHGFSTGVIDITPSGGTPPYSYNWSNNITNQDNIGIPAGNYYLTITDFNGCTETYEFIVTEPPTYVSITLTGYDIRCYGEANGAIDLQIFGGTPPYTVHWNNSAQIEDIYNLVAGWYSVTVTDNNGCTITDSVYISEPGKLYADISKDHKICINDTANIYVSATGGVPPYSYLWNTGSSSEYISVSPSTTTTYTVTVFDAHGCSSVNSTTVFVYPPINAIVNFNKEVICKGDPVIVSANITGGNGNYLVYLNDTLINLPYTFYPSNTNIYNIYIEDDCNTPPFILQQEIIVKDLPSVSFLSDKVEGCEPLTVNFIETTGDTTLLFEWNFGDNYILSSFYNVRNPTHTYYSAGSYSVTLTVENKYNCKNSLTLEKLINVYPKPNAKFTYEPTTITILNPEVKFINLSSGAIKYYWFFGDGDSSHLVHPVHIYPTLPDNYKITLIAISDKGCLDTAYLELSIYSQYTIYAPSAFSPNNDGINETWRVFATNIDYNSFKLSIYDRWGNIIFETNDINEEWNGKYMNNGEIVPVGTYTYVIKYKDFNGVNRSKVGSVTVIY